MALTILASRPISTTFTPAVNGVVRVRVKFKLLWDLSGSGAGGVFCTQSAVSTYGPFTGPPYAVEQAFTAEASFAVVAGSAVQVGLAAGRYGGIYRMSFKDMQLTAEFIPS